jgi:hypothetical protein
MSCLVPCWYLAINFVTVVSPGFDVGPWCALASAGGEGAEESRRFRRISANRPLSLAVGTVLCELMRWLHSTVKPVLAELADLRCQLTMSAGWVKPERMKKYRLDFGRE